MGLRIELETIWRRLQTRFKARRKTDTDPEDPDHPILIETVQPITNIDELLKAWHIGTNTVDVSAGTAIVASTPPGKRWVIRFLIKAATDNATQLRVRDEDGTVANLFGAAATAVYWSEFDIPMDEGWDLILTQGAGTDGAILVTYLYQEEDAY